MRVPGGRSPFPAGAGSSSTPSPSRAKIEIKLTGSIGHHPNHDIMMCQIRPRPKGLILAMFCETRLLFRLKKSLHLGPLDHFNAVLSDANCLRLKFAGGPRCRVL